jgi:thiamine-phosphate pyrophosphorylase
MIRDTHYGSGKLENVMNYDYSLYYVLDLPTDEHPVELARKAVAGGASIVQLRGKQATGRELYQLALALKLVLEPMGVPLIVNDRLDVALAAGTDGVHVGADDLPFEVVRRLAPDLIVGVSCYGSLEIARHAAAAGADYLAFGAFYPSPTKPEAELVPLSLLAEARRLALPVVAIGGITLERVPELVRAGADGISVVSAIQGAADPERAAQALRAAIEQQRRTLNAER